MLLHKLMFGDRQAIPEEEILERVVVQNIQDVEIDFMPDLEIIAQIRITQTEPSFPTAHEFPQGLAGMGQILRTKFAHGFQGGELGQRIQFL